MATCESKPAKRLMWGAVIGIWMFGAAAVLQAIAALITAL